ncbi:MAG: hypothetical protein IBJ11_09195 [Phycisphaerales bacterium]|nr:hypothetical protein [Phycisphaerales bacterium]
MAKCITRALAKARALMQPAADGTPSPWANDEDAKALLAEAERLIDGPQPAPTQAPASPPAAPPGKP